MKGLRPEANPFRQRRIKTIIVSLILLVASAFGLMYYYNQRPEPLKVTYPVCDLSQEAIVEKFSEYKYTDKIEMKDHFFYGETLSMFNEEYDIKEKNSLLGKTIVLENLCSGDEYIYLIDDYVDGQIPLGQLPNGMYEVFINVNLIKQRVVVNEKFSDSINLLRRSSISRKAELIGDRNIFDDIDNTNILDDNYLFISVDNRASDSSDYDIVLDPRHKTNVSGWHTNLGIINGDLIEADETYKMAKLIKAELEKKGLKVLLTRNDEDEVVNVYGKDGRLERAYNSKAKYYVEIGWDNANVGGLKVYNSLFSSIQLSGAVAKELLVETNLESHNNSGVYQMRPYYGLDGHMVIREVGGKALSAATVSDLAVEQNSSFALNNPYGLEAISIDYINGKSIEQVNKWKDSKEQWAKVTAKAILDFLDVGESNDLSN